MVDEMKMKAITKELFSLKRKYSDERIKVATIENAHSFIKKFPKLKINSFSNDDFSVIGFLKKLLEEGEDLLVVANDIEFRYEIYTSYQRIELTDNNKISESIIIGTVFGGVIGLVTGIILIVLGIANFEGIPYTTSIYGMIAGFVVGSIVGMLRK